MEARRKSEHIIPPRIGQSISHHLFMFALAGNTHEKSTDSPGSRIAAWDHLIRPPIAPLELVKSTVPIKLPNLTTKSKERNTP